MSNTTKKLMPLTDLSKVTFTDKKSGDIQIKYLKGMPRKYRFDASKGLFSLNSKIPLTEKGDSFTIIPVAFQVFTDDILGEQYERMRWVELIFLNQSLQVCSLLLHGYSVDNLLSKADELFYDGANFCQVKLTILPIQKTSTNPKANGAKYWMAFFKYELVDQEGLTKLETATKGLEFYRKDIYTINREIELSQNYGIPKEIQKALAGNKAAENVAEKVEDTAEVAKATA